MSLPSSANPVVPREKQATNVYTVMLILSFLALLIGTIVLYNELKLYGKFPWWKASASGPPVSAPAAPAAAPVAPAGGAAPVAPAAPAVAPAVPAGGAAAPAPMPAAAS